MLYFLQFPEIMTACAFCIYGISSHDLIFMAEHILQTACERREQSFHLSAQVETYLRVGVLLLLLAQAHAHKSH